MSEEPTAQRRRELLEQYRRMPKNMGVYLIRNTVNNKCFVGMSRDIRARFNRHQMDLRTHSERTPNLQPEWNEFGADAFEFETLELLEPMDEPGYDANEDLEVLLDIWLEKLQPFAPAGYNVKK